MIDNIELKEFLGDSFNHVFFSGTNLNSSTLFIYVKDSKTYSNLSNKLKKIAAVDSRFRHIIIKKSSSLALAKTRSLEAILNKLPAGQILIDPTATIERSTALVCIAKQARRELGSNLLGCYFNSEQRQIHFLLTKFSDVRQQLEPILLHHTQRLSKPFSYSFTVSSQTPKGNVIAIDDASIVKTKLFSFAKSALSKLKWPLVFAAASSSFGISVAKAHVGSLPAVSTTNLWLGAAGGWAEQSNFDDNNNDDKDGKFSGFGEGAVAIPLGHEFGAQVHGYDGSIADNNIFSFDGIIFWRNPAVGLAGPVAKYIKMEDDHQTTWGLHGEAYVGPLTAVAEIGGVDHSTLEDTYYGQAVIHWYPNPELQLYAGGVLAHNDKAAGQIGVEYQMGLSVLPGLSIFADVGAASHDLKYAYLGIRNYFGNVKSLIRRHREDNVLPTLDLLLPNKMQLVPIFTS